MCHKWQSNNAFDGFGIIITASDLAKFDSELYNEGTWPRLLVEVGLDHVLLRIKLKKAEHDVPVGEFAYTNQKQGSTHSR